MPAVGYSDRLEGVQLLGDLLDPSAVDQLVEVEGRSAVRTLRSLLGQPSSYAGVAAQLAAVRAEMRVAQLFHADEASEYLRQSLRTETVSDQTTMAGIQKKTYIQKKKTTKNLTEAGTWEQSSSMTR